MTEQAEPKSLREREADVSDQYTEEYSDHCAMLVEIKEQRARIAELEAELQIARACKPDEWELVKSCERAAQSDLAKARSRITNLEAGREVAKKACLEYAERVKELEAENKRLKTAIESFGNNPAGFDWAVLEKIETLEAKLAAAEKLAEQLERCFFGYASHEEPEDMAELKRCLSAFRDTTE